MESSPPKRIDRQALDGVDVQRQAGIERHRSECGNGEHVAARRAVGDERIRAAQAVDDQRGASAQILVADGQRVVAPQRAFICAGAGRVRDVSAAAVPTIVNVSLPPSPS